MSLEKIGIILLVITGPALLAALYFVIDPENFRNRPEDREKRSPDWNARLW